MNYYSEIKNKIIENEVYIKVKDYSKERNTVAIYFEIGKLLYDQRTSIMIQRLGTLFVIKHLISTAI